MLVLPNVHLIPVEGRDPLYSSNLYAIGTEEDLILVDPGEDHWYTRESAVEAILAYLRDAGLSRVRAIFHTHHHPDHVSAGPELRERLHAKVIAPAGDAAEIAKYYKGREADQLIRGGDSLEVAGWCGRIIHAPGHTDGHVCLLFEDQGILFSGDNVLGHGTTAIVPPEGDLGLFLATLRSLRSLSCRIICPGHGPLVCDPRRRIDALIDHRRRRERQLLSLLAGDGKTLSHLTHEIYDGEQVKPIFLPWAEEMVLSNLIKLEREGKVIREERDGMTFYCRASR